MSISYSVTAVTGTVKLLDNQYASYRDALSDLANNPNASSITTPFTLGPPNKYILIFENESTVTIGFTPDISLADGQGFKIKRFRNLEITAVSGTVKYISDKHLKYTDDASDAWSNSKAVSVGVGDIVGSGFLLCDKYGSFSYKSYSDIDGDIHSFSGNNGTVPAGVLENIKIPQDDV